MKLKIFFCQFPNPWTLRVSGMGGYNSKCEKKSKSLHSNVEDLRLGHGGGGPGSNWKPISNAGFRDHTGPLFAQLKILPLDQILKLNAIKFMHSFPHNLLSISFNQMWISNSMEERWSNRTYWVPAQQCLLSTCVVFWSLRLQCVAESSIRLERVPDYYEVYFVSEPCKELATKGRLCFDYSELMCACYILYWLNQ